jgi:arginine deiminase
MAVREPVSTVGTKFGVHSEVGKLRRVMIHA